MVLVEKNFKKNKKNKKLLVNNYTGRGIIWDSSKKEFYVHVLVNKEQGLYEEVEIINFDYHQIDFAQHSQIISTIFDINPLDNVGFNSQITVPVYATYEANGWRKLEYARDVKKRFRFNYSEFNMVPIYSSGPKRNLRDIIDQLPYNYLLNLKIAIRNFKLASFYRKLYQIQKSLPII